MIEILTTGHERRNIANRTCRYTMSKRDNGTCKSMYNAKLKKPTNKQTKKEKKEEITGSL